MLDLVCSLALLGVLLATSAAYLARIASAGRKRFERVERDGGSPLLGKQVLAMGYSTLR